MKNLSKIFDGIRKGIEMLERASKVLNSIECVSKNLKNTVDELEVIWGTKKPEMEEIKEA